MTAHTLLAAAATATGLLALAAALAAALIWRHVHRLEATVHDVIDALNGDGTRPGLLAAVHDLRGQLDGLDDWAGHIETAVRDHRDLIIALRNGTPPEPPETVESPEARPTEQAPAAEPAPAQFYAALRANADATAEAPRPPRPRPTPGHRAGDPRTTEYSATELLQRLNKGNQP